MVINTKTMNEGTRELPVSSKRLAKNGQTPEKNAHLIREITSRLAIYRKLKELGHSDDTIFAVYKKSDKEN